MDEIEKSQAVDLAIVLGYIATKRAVAQKAQFKNI